jgi:hypothetical protein
MGATTDVGVPWGPATVALGREHTGSVDLVEERE